MVRPQSHHPQVGQWARRAGRCDACIGLAKVESKTCAQLIKEQSAVYDSQPNGGTEVGVRLVRGLLRTAKLCPEARVGE